MKKKLLILSIAMLLVIFQTNVFAQDTGNTIPIGNNTTIISNQSSKTDTYLVEPGSKPFTREGDKLVRTYSVRLTDETSVGDLMNAVRVCQLIRGSSHTVTKEKKTEQTVIEDYTITASVSASFLEIIKSEIKAIYNKHVENKITNTVSVGEHFSFATNEEPLDATHKTIYAGFFKDKHEHITEIVEEASVEKKTFINDVSYLSDRNEYHLEDGRVIIHYLDKGLPKNVRIEGDYYIETEKYWDYDNSKKFKSYMYVPVKGFLAQYTIK